MSLRWRADGRLLCAAKTEPESGDTYIDDRLHYALSSGGSIEPSIDEEVSGAWFWRYHTPYYAKPESGSSPTKGVEVE